jgi:predicted aspartyl protease
MRSLVALGGALCAMTSSSTMAQSFQVMMLASKRNMVACATADMNWTRTWSLVVSGDTATMSTSGANAITLKKTIEGVYETTAYIGGDSVTFTSVTQAGRRSMKVVGKRLGCVWEGSAEPFIP